MRKNYLAIIALSACALVACNKQEKEIVNEVPGTVEMTVVAGDAATKTALSGATIIWSGTEKLTVVEEVTGGTDNNKCFAKESSAGTSSDGGATMNFNVSLNTHTGATSFRYAAFYPSSAYQAVTNMSNVAVNTPYEQSPTSDSYDPAADLLISEISASSASQPTNINMAFARKVAIGKMTVKNLASDDDVVTVSFSAKQGATDVVLAGRSRIDFATSTVNYGSNIQNKTLTMDFSGDGVTMNTSEGAPVYFVCYPFELNVTNAGEFTVVVETATHRYTRNVVLTGVQTLNFTPGDVSRFSVDMTSAEVVAKAVSLHYAEFTKADAYSAGATSGTYAVINSDKTHGDKWAGKVNYTNGGFGLRNTLQSNDSYLKLPDFAEKIMTVTVELSQAFVHNNDPLVDTYLSLETASNISSKSIASLDQVDDQMTYVFNVSAANVKTAYLRATGAAAYIKKVIVTTAKADSRTQLSAPTSVAAALDGTNDIALTWTKAANAIGYEIVCTPAVGDPVVTEVGDVASYKVEGLANNTVYTITMYSIPDYYTHTKSDAAASTPTTVETTKGASYILDGTITGGTNGYATESDISQNGISWKVTGNTTQSPWRIGGSSLSGIDRPIYSTGKIDDDISQIKLTHGTANSITVNSLTVIVSKNSDFSSPVSTLTPSFVASNTITINRPDGKDWSECYYKFIYNVTTTGSGSKFVQFTKAEFYE